MSDHGLLCLVPPPRTPPPDTRGCTIRRVAAELPPDARAAVERSVSPLRGAAYRAYDPAQNAAAVAWYPVVDRPPPGRGRALMWPAVRTAVPAGASVALLGSLVVLAGSLDPVGVVGTALGSVLGAIVARTQYKLEREQHALGSLWLAADYSRVLVGRYDSLPARLTGRARWYVLPLAALCPQDDAPPSSRRAPKPGAADPAGGDGTEESRALAVVPDEAEGFQDDMVLRSWRRWHARMQRIGYALAALGIDGTAVDAQTAERVHTLARLARFRRFAQRT